MSFELAQKVADAVLYEGYVLYPYRASAVKNRLRWQFGVVVPRGYAELGGSEPWAMQTEVLVEGDAPALDLRVRFLQVQARTIEEEVDGAFRPVESLEMDGKRLVTWEEGVERRIDCSFSLFEEQRFPIEISGGREVEQLRGARVVRERWPLEGVVRVVAERLDGLVKVRLRIENLSKETATDRGQAMRHSLIGAHTLLAVRGGAFVSLLDPPPEAAAAAAACSNQHTWPVLIGPEGDRGIMLSSPIILYDHPAVAPESQGDLCDATEIDEILTLRVMTLTEEEKREARGTDERARQIVERSDAIPPEILDRLHGAVRSLDPVEPDPFSSWEAFLNPPGMVSPDEAWVEVKGTRVSKGSRVLLQPCRRADSMDLFLAGRTARIEGVFRDLEDVAYLAVALEDDPASDLHVWHGRFLYFYPEEVEPLDSDRKEEAPCGA